MEDAPGFARVKLTPRPDPRLNWAEVSVCTASGLYSTKWEKNESNYTFRFEIPFNCSAELCLPVPAVVDGSEVEANVTTVLTAGTHRAVIHR